VPAENLRNGDVHLREVLWLGPLVDNVRHRYELSPKIVSAWKIDDQLLDPRVEQAQHGLDNWIVDWVHWRMVKTISHWECT
jgi:hypothetical protein